MHRALSVPENSANIRLCSCSIEFMEFKVSNLVKSFDPESECILLLNYNSGSWLNNVLVISNSNRSTLSKNSLGIIYILIDIRVLTFN